MSTSETSSSGYQPQYVSYDDVPFAGPDDYDKPEKERAVWAGESALEADVAGGSEINNPEKIHAVAVACFATHVLSGGAEAPDSVRIGDLGNDDIAGYAQTYMDLYRHMVHSINDAVGDEGSVDHTVITQP